MATQVKQEFGAIANAERAFRGYAPPTSSTTYTPNQFFDVVLPNASRGCLRLVAYLIRKTLGWSDANGNPQNPEATISYRELEASAGIGRGRVKEAIDEAIANRYVECLRFGKPHRAGDAGYSALYSLKWGRQDRYVSDPDEFDGFFAGNGNLTHIPNQFFDFTVPSETLAVVKVVGVIIRSTIGFQTKFGFRRQEASLSFSDIMRRAAIGSRTTLSGAIKSAIDGRHIRVVSQGVFDTNAGLESRAAVYGVNWSDEFPAGDDSRTRQPAKRVHAVSEHRPVARRPQTTPKLDRGMASASGPKKPPYSGPESPPDLDWNQPRNWTAIKTTSLNNSTKQHQSAECRGRESEEGNVLSGLLAQGIELKTAERLVRRYPKDQIERQLAWLPLRRVKSSRTGLLIRAIEHDIAAPERELSEDPRGRAFAAHYYAEIGGNKEEPLAQPSADEVRSAAAFLDQLGPQGSDGETGRAFARHVVLRSKLGRFMPQSFILALRMHADSFASSQRRYSCRASTGGVESRTTSLEANYRSFVRMEAKRLFEDPSLRASFEADIALRLESCRRLSERGFEMLRKELETEDGRCQLFEEYLSKHHPALIADFPNWNGATKSSLGDAEAESTVQRIRA
ncbi:MAG: hypothetical protein KIS66_06265 [Fimbriimonadaceae bacterium]|nr:hypothetical protein [Fimbriimonadaceae bacterium]